MFIKWFRRIIEDIKAEEQQRRLEKDALLKEQIDEWKQKYFKDIVFPILILGKSDYTGVSDLEEYFLDVDINIWFIRAHHELIDSLGQKYDFKQTDQEEWVPDKR